jgi:S-DNA-T family DNA segregation ATPase FtsK/SpoIIIE
MGDMMTGTPATTPPGGPEGQAAFTAALLQGVLNVRKIGAMVAPLWIGPSVISFACSLTLGEDPRKVEALAGALALAAGVDSARVAMSDGRLIIEVPRAAHERKPLRAGRLAELTPPARTAVALGITTGGKVVWYDLADPNTPHLLIAGATGSGKSVAAHWLIDRLAMQNDPAELRFIMCDPKAGELRPFAALPHLLHPVTSAPLEMAALLGWAMAELDRRLVTGQRAPRLVLILEELADLQKTTPGAMEALARVAQIGRGCNVHAVGITQHPNRASLGEGLANFRARLLGQVASQTLTFSAAGRGKTSAHDLLGGGDMLLITPGATRRLQIPLIDGRQYSQLPRAAQVASLAEELPTLANLADLARDRRGGAGRRELGQADYAAMTADLENGATPDNLRDAYGIGYPRARRLWAQYHGAEAEE